MQGAKGYSLRDFFQSSRITNGGIQSVPRVLKHVIKHVIGERNGSVLLPHRLVHI